MSPQFLSDPDEDIESALANEAERPMPVVMGYAFQAEGEPARQVLRACERLLGRRIGGANERADAEAAMTALHVAARRLGSPLRRTTASCREGIWRLGVDGEPQARVAALFGAAAKAGEFLASASNPDLPTSSKSADDIVKL